MWSISILLVGVFAKCALSTGENEIRVSPCGKTDHSCYVNIIRQLTKNVIEGIPDQNVKSLDPLIIPSVDYEILDGVYDHFTNVNITGMKNAEVVDIDISFEKSVAELKLKLNISVIADVSSEFTQVPSKTLSGVFRANIYVETVSKYGVAVNANDKGVKYITLLQENTTCESTADPEVIINPELLDAFNNDLELKFVVDAYNNDKLNLNKQQTCYIAKAAVSKLFENYRAASKNFSADKFFTGV